MTTTQGIESLQLLAQREQQLCDTAQGALRQADDAARRARDQHQQLLAYRGEYEARWSAQFHQGGTMDILQYYRSFMQRLEQAIDAIAVEVERMSESQRFTEEYP